MNDPATPTEGTRATDGSSRAWDIFMIIAFGVGIFYLVSFQIRYPDYWYAVLLFLIIAVVGIIRRVASLIEGGRAREVGDSEPLEPGADGSTVRARDQEQDQHVN